LNPVEEFILKQKGAQQELLAFLHPYLIEKGLRSRISYGLPFYYGHKWVCYLKPNKDGSLDFSFPRASEFADPTGLLEIRERKQIKSLLLHDLESLPFEAIEQIITRAIELDQSSSAN